MALVEETLLLPMVMVTSEAPEGLTIDYTGSDQKSFTTLRTFSQLSAFRDDVVSVIGAANSDKYFSATAFPSLLASDKLKSLNAWFSALASVINDGLLKEYILVEFLDDSVVVGENPHANKIKPVLAEDLDKIPPAGWVRVVFARHGQADHNVATGGSVVGAVAYRDPHLTEAGQLQALTLGEALPKLEYDLVIVSPLRRALQTCALSLSERKETISKSVVQPLCAEHRFLGQRDGMGTKCTTLEKEFEVFKFPRGDPQTYPPGLQEEWWSIPLTDTATAVLGESAGRVVGSGLAKLGSGFSSLMKKTGVTPPKSLEATNSGWETKSSFRARCRNFFTWLRKVPQDVNTVLMFSHGGFLVNTFGGPKLQNCEWRAVDVQRVPSN